MIMISLYDDLLSQFNLTCLKKGEKQQRSGILHIWHEKFVAFQDFSSALWEYELLLSIHYTTRLAFFLIFRQLEHIGIVHYRELNEVVYGTWLYS